MERGVEFPVDGASLQCRRSGQVLVVLLLGVTLLAGLIFYVINVGDQINRRLAMQNAADSAAVSGSAWMARSMNVIAGNNVAITRMLALVPHLDSFPLATKMTYEEVDAWEKGLGNQLGRGVPDEWMRDELESLRLRMAEQRDILGVTDNLFNHSDFDVASLTNWSIHGYAGPPPHGHLWQAAESLDEFSQATALSAGPLSQANAARYGQSDYAETAFITPVLPELPARRTDFGDFESPVKEGIIPDREHPHRLGPYDRLFRWRNYRMSGVWVSDQSGISSGSRMVNVGSQGHTGSGHWEGDRTVIGYSVYGPYRWMLYRIHNYAIGDRSVDENHTEHYTGELADTNYYKYHKDIADIKLGYMWDSKTLKEVHYPRWTTDYPTAKAMSNDETIEITSTMFYHAMMYSRYPRGHADYGSPGSYIIRIVERAEPLTGWHDPADWGIGQTANYIWEEMVVDSAPPYWLERLGVPEILDPDTGEPIWQDIYEIHWYIFGGIDVGTEVQVSNPSNFCGTCDENPPAPILIDTGVGDYDMGQPHHDTGVRRSVFTYLGVAGQNSEPAVWASRFGQGNPFGQIVAVSQAEIFNTTSWDLWTQDWKTQLVPVTQWSNWVERMADGAADASVTAGLVEPETVSDFAEYLGRFDEQMVNEMLHH